MSGRFGSYRTSYGTSYRRRGRGRGGLTGNQLKTLGGLFLLLDHIGAVVIQGGILHGRDREAFLAAAATDLGQRLLALSRILRYCGRLSFPIFAFLLTEGFIHTSDRVRYCIRLGVLACISEPLFDMAVYGTFFYPDYQNTIFTLWLGLLVLTALEYLSHPALQFLALLAGCALSWILKTDYNVLGILLIGALYWFRYNDTARLVWGMILSALESLSCFCISALAYAPIVLYNGRRGAREWKYVYYAFYPVHLVLLYVIAGWAAQKAGI